MALTAGAPIFRGLLADVDCRWSVISQAVDCRTKEERGQEVCLFFLKDAPAYHTCPPQLPL